MKIATTIEEMYSFAPTPAEAVRCYRGTGFKYLDYSFYHAHTGSSPFTLDGDSAWKKEVTDAGIAAEEEGFSFVQAHAPGYNPAKPADHPVCMRAMLRSVDACGMLGIPCMVLHTSFGPSHIYPGDKESYFAYNREFLAPLLEKAEKYNVTLCIENTTKRNMGDYYFPRTTEDMNELAAFINHPLLKCCWDTGHAVLEGHYDQYEDFIQLKDTLRAVHIHDNNAIADRHLPPYCGKLDLGRVVEGLKAINYSGYFTFEATSFMNKGTGTGPAKNLPLEIRRDALSVLFRIGKFVLETYGAFEE